MSSAPQPAGLDVGENVSDDLAKVGGAQRLLLQVLTVPAAGRDEEGQLSHMTTHSLTDWLADRGGAPLVGLVDVLFGEAGVSVLLQMAADPVAGVQLV